jgi:hypothetical protein
MTVIDRLILLVKDLRRGEQGMALPVALFAMISGMALAGAAVVATVDAQSGAHRDDSSKQAIAAADAGANIARARQTHYAFILNPLNPCLEVGSGGKLEKAEAELVGGQEWCPEVEGTVGGNSYVYRVSPVGLECGGSDELCVVSTGTAGEVSRRIEVTYKRSGLVTNESEKIAAEERHETELIERKLEEAEQEGNEKEQKHLEEELQKQKEEESRNVGVEGFVGRDGIVLSGNANIRVGLGTNGDLETSGNASICGDIRHGIGKTWTKSGNATQCSGYEVTEGNVELPPVSSFIPTDIATNNSNGRITTCSASNLPVDCQKDYYSGSWTHKPPFNPTTRAITLTANETLTVGGGDYWICSLSMSGNSELIMAEGATVRFFFDTPEHCGTGNQISLSGNNRISATGYQPSDGQYGMPGFYLLGSPTVSSQVSLSGNYSTTDEMIVYAPDTEINISGNATFKGIIAGKQINMSGNGTVEQDAGFQVPPELRPGTPEIEGKDGGSEGGEEASPGETEEEREERIQHEEEERVQKEKEKTNTGAIYFTPQAYFECTGTAAPGSAPNAGC